MNEPTFVTKLKKKWKIESNWDFFMIMIVFSLAGMMVSVIRPPLFHLLHISDHTPFWIKVIVYIPLVPPIYQASLLLFGTLLGQFPFFWEKQKQIGRFLARPFVSKIR